MHAGQHRKRLMCLPNVLLPPYCPPRPMPHVARVPYPPMQCQTKMFPMTLHHPAMMKTVTTCFQQQWVHRYFLLRHILRQHTHQYRHRNLPPPVPVQRLLWLPVLSFVSWWLLMLCWNSPILLVRAILMHAKNEKQPPPHQRSLH